MKKSQLRMYGLMFLLFGVTFFWAGWHNIDLAFNMLNIAYMENIDLDKYVDISASGNEQSYIELYMSGCNLMMISLIFTIMGTALLFKYL